MGISVLAVMKACGREEGCDCGSVGEGCISLVLMRGGGLCFGCEEGVRKRKVERCLWFNR